MAISSLRYAPPVRRAQRFPEPDFDLMDAAMALFDEGEARAAMDKVFAHLFPNQAVPDLAAAPFVFTQGAARVSVRIENDEFTATVPLVQMPAGGSAVAALRFVVTRISSPGQLHQPRLHGEVLKLEFRDKLTRLHPAKVVDSLRRIAVQADGSADWLIGQFNAVPVARSPIEPVSDDEFARCSAVWREHWNDIEELQKESHKKRSVFFLDEVTAYALSRVHFALPLQGFLGARLTECAAGFIDGEIEPLKRETALAKCIKEMKAVTPEQLRSNLGHAVYTFRPLSDGTPAMLSHYFEGGNDTYMNAIEELKREGQATDAALGLIGTYNFLLARHCWPDEVEAVMKAGLEQVSGKPWREAATVLLDHARALAAQYGGPEEAEDDEEEAYEEDDA